MAAKPDTVDGKDKSHLFVFTNDKAGMSGQQQDKDHAARVIYEMSKGSRFIKHAEHQDGKVDVKMEEMRRKLSTLDDSTRSKLERKIEVASAQLQSARKLNSGTAAAANFLTHLSAVRNTEEALSPSFPLDCSVCVVCDMDQFYAAVEMRDRPELADKPMAVGGEGMICTANYAARK